MDLLKAFGKVPNEWLLSKLLEYCISGNIHNWLVDWLSEGKNRVVLNGASSHWPHVRSCAPHGPVLSLTAFLIYVNNVDDGLACKLSKVAADTKIASKGTTTLDEEALQSDPNRLACWASQCKIKFNVDNMCTVRHRTQS